MALRAVRNDEYREVVNTLIPKAVQKANKVCPGYGKPHNVWAHEWNVVFHDHMDHLKTKLGLYVSTKEET